MVLFTASVLSMSVIAQPAVIAALPHKPPFENESTKIVGQAADGTCYIRDGWSGSLEAGLTAEQAINGAIEDIYTEGDGGRIFIKEGLYALASPINIEGRSGLTIEGSENAILSTPEFSGAALLITAHSSHVTLRALRFRNCGGFAINLLSGSDVTIRDCHFQDIQSCALQVRTIDDPEDPVINLRFVGNTIDGAGLTGSPHRAVHAYRVHNAVFSENIIQNCDGIGINIQHASGHLVVQGNVIRDNGFATPANGIYVGSGSGTVVIAHNTVTNNTGNGLEAASGVLDDIEQLGASFVISNNVFTANGNCTPLGCDHPGAGIFVTGSGHVVEGNICELNAGPGIKVGYSDRSEKILISNNSIRDNGSLGAGRGFSCGIVVNGPAESDGDELENVIIRGNQITDVRGYQLHAVYCVPGSGGIFIEDNYFRGNPEPQVNYHYNPIALNNPVVRGNRGFRDSARASFVVVGGSAVAGFLDYDLAGDLDLDNTIGPTPLAPDGFTASLHGSLVPSTAVVTLRTEFLTGTVFRIHWTSDTPIAELGLRWHYTHEP
ncbi:MAG: right-handed parallel beta-helix repeat-containing protein [Phycisphaerae bacterium]|nr:right-handed parallel beta-helix repeat-containing protein [Phycisphaerae bacterium]